MIGPDHWPAVGLTPAEGDALWLAALEFEKIAPLSLSLIVVAQIKLQAAGLSPAVIEDAVPKLYRYSMAANTSFDSAIVAGIAQARRVSKGETLHFITPGETISIDGGGLGE